VSIFIELLWPAIAVNRSTAKEASFGREPLRSVSVMTLGPEACKSAATDHVHGVRVMDQMQALHELDAFATWQGGFDYYFAHVEDEAVWASACEGLIQNSMAEAATLFSEARMLFKTLGSEPANTDEAVYFAKMRKLDERWRDYVPALHKILAEWRKPRGLEEFGLPGW
jgi:hypothetical protein